MKVDHAVALDTMACSRLPRACLFASLFGVATSLVGPAPAFRHARSPVVRSVLAEPSVASPADLAKDFDLKAYFAKKVAAVEKALDESLTCTTPETKIIVESMRRALPRPRAGRGSMRRASSRRRSAASGARGRSLRPFRPFRSAAPADGMGR